MSLHFPPCTTAKQLKKRLAALHEKRLSAVQLAGAEAAALWLFLLHAGEETPKDMGAPRREFEAVKEEVERLRYKTQYGKDIVRSALIYVEENLLMSIEKAVEQDLHRFEALIEVFNLDPRPRPVAQE